MKTSDWHSQHWYYSVELEPGIFTKADGHHNIALTRKLLRNIDVRGKDCIDVGTQEGLVPILLKKAGAQRVVAYDRMDLSQKVLFLQELYGVQFEYIPGIQLRDLPARLDREFGTRFFDLVAFSGVLYHAIDPFGFLALVRGLCKIGSLFLLETVARQQPEELLIFNTKGAYGRLTGNTYFVPTTAWLDYALRMVALEPLYAVYLGSLHPQGYARLAISCRSMPRPCPRDPSDVWVHNHWHREAFQDESQVDWARLEKTESDIAFEPYDGSVTKIDDRGLFECLAQPPAVAHKPEPWEIRLELKRGI
jgi:hypothetical protein